LAAGHSTIGYFPKDKVYLVVIYAGMRSLQAKMGATTITDLSVTAVPPDVPTLSSITFSSLDSTIDSSLTVVAAGGTLGSATLPTYTKPTITTRVAFADYWTVGDFGDSDPGELSVTVPPDTPDVPELSGIGTAPTYTKPTQTFDIGQFETFLEANEDTELAQAQMARLQLELGEFQANIQNELNEFNKENVEFQATIQRETQEDTLILQKYQADLGVYQAEVGAQVQGYTQKLQRYTTELGTVFQAWQKTESDSLQQYQLDLQNELNEFNKENARYQANIQAEIAKFQSQNQMNITNAERSQNRQLQNSINDMKVIFDNNAQLIQKFGAEMQEYQAEVGTQVQEYTQNLQADGMGYQWLQGQYAALKAEYDGAFMIAAPKPQPQQQVRR
jgi:hypothetical protein